MWFMQGTNFHVFLKTKRDVVAIITVSGALVISKMKPPVAAHFSQLIGSQISV